MFALRQLVLDWHLRCPYWVMKGHFALAGLQKNNNLNESAGGASPESSYICWCYVGTGTATLPISIYFNQLTTTYDFPKLTIL